MLLRFTVENLLSFRQEASLSMIPVSDRNHPSHISDADNDRGPPALRVAAIYGANGHGKSNLVEAVIALQRLIRGKSWRLSEFKLDPDLAGKPSKVVIEFRHLGKDYEYGAVVSEEYIAEEWLFATDQTGKEQKIFERVTEEFEDEKFKTTFQAGKALSKLKSPAGDVSMSTFLKVLGSGIKPNVAFISEASQRQMGPLSDAFSWLDAVLTPVSATSSYSPLFERMTNEDDFRAFVGAYIKKCDVGISSIDTQRVKLEPSFLESLPKSFLSKIEALEAEEVVEFGTADGTSLRFEKDEAGEVYANDLASYRKNLNGELVRFSLEEESSGTRRMFDLLPMIANDGDGRVFIVDELDRKLHPMLAYELVKGFIESNSKQLVFTTHNTYLMSLELLRRDEIWFVQKRSDGSSDLYSLSDLKVRSDLNIRKGYISGRFGAIPFFGNTTDLGWNSEEAASDDAYKQEA